MKTAVQLYSLREAEGDFFEILKRVKKIGYDGVEFAGFFDRSASELKRVLEDLNLVSVASHTSLGDLKNNLLKTLEYNAEIGTKFIVLPHANFSCEKDYQDMASFCGECADAAKSFGMGFGYHNHDFEFKDKFNGKTGHEILLSQKSVQAQLDVFWINRVGLNPVDLIKKYDGRVPIIHLKDSDKNFEFTEVGNGIVNIKDCIKTGLQCGTEWFTVEQDFIKIDKFESIRISLENIKNICLEILQMDKKTEKL